MTRPIHVSIEDYVVLRDAFAEAMNYILDADYNLYHTPTTLRLTEILDSATALCDSPSSESDIDRLRNRVACRLDKIIAREDISEQAREAVRFLLVDLHKMHTASL